MDEPLDRAALGPRIIQLGDELLEALRDARLIHSGEGVVEVRYRVGRLSKLHVHEGLSRGELSLLGAPPADA